NVSITPSGGDADRQVEVTWTTPQNVAMETNIEWPLKLAQADGWAGRTKYSLDGVTFTPAPLCLSSTPPFSYGTLSAAINDSTTTTFGITSASLPAAPVAIVIPSNVAGTAPERILVKAYTAVAGGFSVTDSVRGAGGTPASTHSASAPV